MTYRIKWIIAAIVVWELIFWGLYFVILKVIGAAHGTGADHVMFKVPSALNLLFLLIPVTGVYLYNVYRHNRLVGRTSDRVVRSYLKPVSTFSSFARYFFFRNALALLIIALAQPIYGKKKVAGTSETLELVICLDISNSMNAHDISDDLSRLDVAKRALVQLVNNLHGEKIGLCLFANHAFVHLPLTRDYPAAKLFIDEIETYLLSSQGTNVAEALEVASNMFTKEKTTKGILLVTDGENHETNPDLVLRKIRDSKIQLIVMGIGTAKGGVIPKNPDRPELGYKTDAMGKTVISKLNKSFIEKIASKGGGHAHTTSDEFPDLSALLTEINQMKRTKIDTLDFEVKEERYQIPLFISLIFWLTYLLWSGQYVGFLDRFIK